MSGNPSDSPREVLEVLRLSEDYFSRKGVACPRVDAEILLAHVLGCKRFELYMRHDQPLKEEELSVYREHIRRRGSGVPVQHLTGEQDFYALKMQVSDKVLIPRPETEILVETAFKKVAPEGDSNRRRVLEIGSGTGAISIALAVGWQQAELWSVDLSLDALDVARGNARYHEVLGRLHLLHGDLFEPVMDQPPFDLIISNPPYIVSSEIEELDVEVRTHEPHLALDGGSDGLDIIRRIVATAPSKLLEKGWLLLEIGANQGVAVLKLLEESGEFETTDIQKDLAGRDRIVCAQKHP